MKEDDYRRSQAFLADYHALCERHGVQIVSYDVDLDHSVLAAVAFDSTRGDEEVERVYSEREADEAATQARRWGIREAAEAVLASSWCTVDELADKLALACAYYHPMYRDLFDEVVDGLKRERPELFRGGRS